MAVATGLEGPIGVTEGTSEFNGVGTGLGVGADQAPPLGIAKRPISAANTALRLNPRNIGQV